MLMLFVVVLQGFAPSASPLEASVRTFIESQARKTNFSIQVAYHSSTDSFSVSAGRSKHGTVLSSDRFLFGSGTKPYTASSVFRLVDSGQISLDDPACFTIDIGLRKLGSTATFISLFGPKARKVTIGMLLRMQSGITDFDVPSFDNRLLTNSSRPHSPLEFIEVVTSNRSATFVCEPGSCTSYSSTNYILAGLVLLGASRIQSWEMLDQTSAFPSKAEFPLSSFVDFAPIREVATIAGKSRGFSASPIEIWEQDASILGWTCGNLVAPAEEVARFLYALLVQGTVVSASSLAIMKTTVPLDVGWAKGYISYGAGLMVQQTSTAAGFPPKLGEWGAYLGHGGDTYGFLSEQGLLPQLNATFSVIANEDYYLNGQYVKFTLACNLIKLAAKEVLGIKLELRCIDL